MNALHPEFKKLAKYDIAKGMPYGIAYPMAYQEQEQEQEQEIYTHTEKNEKLSEVAENFAGRECEKPASLKLKPLRKNFRLKSRRQVFPKRK